MDQVSMVVVGCGHMGRHHARTVASHPGCRLVAVVDADRDRAERLAREQGVAAGRTIPADAEAVVVATPAGTHLDVARSVVDQGWWCLVEKPLATTSHAARALCSPRLFVGHVERFNPAVRAVGPVRPSRLDARRTCRPNGRSPDVDVVMDLMIHDLDLVLALAGGVEWIEPVGSVSNGHGFDEATVRLGLPGGSTARLHASRIADRVERVVDLWEPRGRTHLDLAAGRATRDGEPLAPHDGRDALTAQLDAFLAAIRGEPGAPAVGAAAGCRAVELSERVRDALSG